MSELGALDSTAGSPPCRPSDADGTPRPSDADGAPAPSDPHANVTVMLVMISALLAWAFGASSLRRSDPSPPPPIRSTVNPNTAPWWELAAVPRVGPALAQMIVAHREQSDRRPAFREGADLDQVSGIGPATIRVIAPCMDFE